MVCDEQKVEVVKTLILGAAAIRTANARDVTLTTLYIRGCYSAIRLSTLRLDRHLLAEHT